MTSLSAMMSAILIAPALFVATLLLQFRRAQSDRDWCSDQRGRKRIRRIVKG